MPTVIRGSDNLDSGQVRPVLMTAVASTSGTSIDFTGIPPWAKRITVLLGGLSTNGVSSPQIQIGTSSGVQNSNYLGTGGLIATGVACTASGAGFVLSASGNWSASTTVHGTVTLSLIDASTGLWSCSGLFSSSTAAAIYFTGGSKTLSGVLDRIRITTVNGTDTFDAGSINVMYE